MHFVFAVWCLSSVSGQSLDRDSLLTEAPATPVPGTVRLAAGGNTSWNGALGGGVSGNVAWAPIARVAGDVGAYWQDGEVGPSVRLRFQVLDQPTHGLALSVGARYKTVGFDPRDGELERPGACSMPFAWGSTGVCKPKSTIKKASRAPI